MLIVSGDAGNTNSGNAKLTDGKGTSSNVELFITGERAPLEAGDKIILIDVIEISTDRGKLEISDDIKKSGNFRHGSTLKGEYDIVSDDIPGHQRLLAVVKNVQLDERAVVLPEGYLSGLALAGRGVDAAAWHDLKYGGNGVFAIIDGGALRYDTGSRIDVNSLSLLTGISGSKPLASEALTVAGFIVYGRGDYDTYSSFADAPSVKGGGSSNYVGLGLRTRLDFTGTGPAGTGEAGADKSRPYIEAHAQGGRVKTDFYSSDFADYQGRSASYHASSNYFGAHVGAGYIWNFADTGEVDFYPKYLYPRRGGDSVRLGTGEPVSFDAIQSRRLRLGGRYTRKSGNFQPYVGMAWEREFDGRANAAVYGYPINPINALDMAGDTGIFELGFTYMPFDIYPFFIDLSVQDYTGQIEGVSGRLDLEYRF
jgi:hypothetical protein